MHAVPAEGHCRPRRRSIPVRPRRRPTHHALPARHRGLGHHLVPANKAAFQAAGDLKRRARTATGGGRQRRRGRSKGGGGGRRGIIAHGLVRAICGNAIELGLPQETVQNALEFLSQNGFVKHGEGQWVPTETWLRLDKQSPHIVKHHANWRQKAIQNLEVQTDEDLHYSGIFSVDARTALRVKDRLLAYLQEQMKEFEAAKEEDLFAVGIDFFRVVKPRGT